MAIALLAIGIPGSGKTTALLPFAQKHGLAYINKDDIREEILGDARDQSRNKEIWEEAQRRAEVALASGTSVIVDATNAEAWKRQSTIESLREAGATHVIGLYADIPLETAKERNQSRDRVVPDEVLEHMYHQLQAEPPSLTDGFDTIIPLSKLEEIEATLG